MNQTKFILKSKGVLGALVAILAGLLPLLNVAIRTEELSDLSNQVLEVVSSVLALVGGVTALIGRLKATTRLTLK